MVRRFGSAYFYIAGVVFNIIVAWSTIESATGEALLIAMYRSIFGLILMSTIAICLAIGSNGKDD